VLGNQSLLIKAVRACYAELDDSLGEDVTRLTKWTMVLTHWATAMQAAYVMRATPAHRRTFRESIMLYVKTKSSLCSGGCCWYDWQCYSIMADLFDLFESLMLISQEGMEACQKQNNMFMRLSNNFSNAGRIPSRIKEAGREKVKEFMAQRKQDKKKPQHWLWLRNAFNFMAEARDVFARAEEYTRTGKTLDWETEFEPMWVSFVAIATIHRITRAKWHWNVNVRRARRAGDDEIEDDEPITWVRQEDGRSFKVHVYDEWRRRLVTEVSEYYAPLPCEEDLVFTEDLDPKTKAKLLQRERRKRWAESRKDREEWWRPHTAVDRMDEDDL